MIHDCDNCKYAETPAFFEPCASCGGSSYWEAYVQTNADRIRAMTDEELAEALCLIAGGLGPVSSSDGRDWLDWLRQEATE